MEKLPGIILDKTSAVPLYEQLRKGLYKAIVSGRLTAGTQLPTENELCEQFGISRPVARQAYAALIESGLVERMRGKGTYVRKPDFWSRFLNRQLSYEAEMKIMGLEPRTELLRSEWLTEAPEVFAKLGLAPGDRVWHIVRMRYANEQPFVLVENYVPESIFPGIDSARYDFGKQSLFRVFETDYSEKVVRSRRSISARSATSRFAELFHLHRGSPVLYIENITYDQYDRPIDYSEEYLDGLTQKFEFDVVN